MIEHATLQTFLDVRDALKCSLHFNASRTS